MVDLTGPPFERTAFARQGPEVRILSLHRLVLEQGCNPAIAVAAIACCQGQLASVRPHLLLGRHITLTTAVVPDLLICADHLRPLS